MNVAAALALQSVPFAGLVLAHHRQRDLFLVLYVTALGLLLSVIAIAGGDLVDPSMFDVEAGPMP